MANDALNAPSGANNSDSPEKSPLTPVQEAYRALCAAWPDMEAHGDCGDPDCPVCLTYGRALDTLLSREPQSPRDVAKQLRGSLAFRSLAMARIALVSALTAEDKQALEMAGDERHIWASISALEGDTYFAMGKFAGFAARTLQWGKYRELYESANAANAARKENAFNDLMQTPAPDLAAVELKLMLGTAAKRLHDEAGAGDSVLPFIISDLRRFAGVE